MSKHARHIAAHALFAGLCALRVDRAYAFEVAWRLFAR